MKGSYYFFILNPISGASASPGHYEEIIRHNFTLHGANYSLIRSHHKNDAYEIAKKAVKQGFKKVVAVGGDGTINEIANALVGTDAALGIIPKGSGNGFADCLKISRKPEVACRQLLKATPRAIDVGRIEHRYFVNLAGFGLDAQIGKAFNRGKKRGSLSYYYHTAREIFKFKSSPLEIIIHDKRRALKPLMVVIANGKHYGSGATIAPRAKIDDGFFHVTVVHDMSLIKLLLAIPSVFTGHVDQVKGVETIKTNEITLSIPYLANYHLDGEPCVGSGKLRFELIPRALRILKP